MYDRQENIHVENLKVLAPIMGWVVSEVPKKQVEYGYSKSFSHATDYGEGWFNLKRRFKVAASVAKAGQRAYLDVWPEVETWHRDVEETVVANRELRNCFGFRRRFFDVTGKQVGGRRQLVLDRKQLKEALATGPSSMNAALWLLGVRGLYDAGLRQITGAHDDFVVECREGDAEVTARTMLEVLTREVPEFEPLIGRSDFRPRAEVKWGHNLGPASEANPRGLKEMRL